jgi:hypothetical protein
MYWKIQMVGTKTDHFRSAVIDAFPHEHVVRLVKMPLQHVLLRFPAEGEREPLVVDAKDVEHRGVEVAEVD